MFHLSLGARQHIGLTDLSFEATVLEKVVVERYPFQEFGRGGVVVGGQSALYVEGL